MSRSVSHNRPLKCPECALSFDAPAWLFIDQDERPDLLLRVLDATLNRVSCPGCENVVDGLEPLVIQRRDAQVRWFIAVSEPTAEAVTEVAKQLPPAICGEMIDDRKSIQLTRSEALPGEIVHEAVRSFLLCDSSDQALRLFDTRPELRSTSADDFIDRFLADPGNAPIAEVVQNRRDSLSRFRRAKLNAVFNDCTSSNRREKLDAARISVTLVQKSEQPALWAQQHILVGEELLRPDSRTEAMDLEEAIVRFQMAASELFESRREVAALKLWVRAKLGLGSGYSSRKLRASRANISRALKHLGEAESAFAGQAEKYPAEWARIQLLRAMAYTKRDVDKPADLEQAYYGLHLGLQFITRESHPPLWATLMAQLGMVFARRLHGSHQANLDSSVYCLEEALKVLESSQSAAANAEVHLALSRSLLAREHSTSEERARATHLVRQTLRVFTEDGFPRQWAGAQNHLGMALFREGDHEGALEHLSNAHRVFTEEAFPEEWAGVHRNMANVYAAMVKTPADDAAEIASEHYLKALRHPSDSEHMAALAELGDLCFKCELFEQALQAYNEALNVGDRLFQSASSAFGQTWNAGRLSGISANAAFCHLRFGLQGEAFVRLENGKARTLRDAMSLRQEAGATDAKALEELLSKRQQIIDAKYIPSGKPGHMDYGEVAVRRDDVERKIRIARIEARKVNAAPSNIATLLSLVPAGSTVVAPLVTPKGSVAFVISYGAKAISAEHIVELPGLDTTHLNALTVGTADEPGWLLAYTQSQSESIVQWCEQIDRITERLWKSLIEPIHHALQRLGIPSGGKILFLPHRGMAVLPIHAAWRSVGGVRRYFLDDYTIGYAPTLALAKSKPASEAAARVLTVADMTGDLSFTPYEVASVGAIFGAQNTTPVESIDPAAEVMRRAREHSHLHFACHGSYDWNDVMESRLHLKTKQELTLGALLADLDLVHTRLVTLSACETGLTSVSQSVDEYVGLAAGFLQAGVRAVVSSLWAVEDCSTALLMAEFYRQHIRKGLLPADALRCAQHWLRSLDRNKVVELATEIRDRSSAELWSRLDEERDRLIENYLPNDHPFEHPYYWAAFTATGDVL